MSLSNPYGIPLSAVAVLVVFCMAGSSASAQNLRNPGAQTNSHACPHDDSGLELPDGFCATVFADGIGHARHLVVAPNGVYVNTWSGHGASATGTPLGPDLTDSKWLWSDGSYAGIAKTITSGVSQPKEYRSPMPPMGGAQLSTEQVSALAAYIWGLSHPAPQSSNH